MHVPAELRENTSLRSGNGVAGRPVPDSGLWNALLGPPQLAAAECASLAGAARVRTVLPGCSVFSHTERARSLVALCAGDVALGYRTADGSFHVERPVHAPSWLDQSSAWLGDTHSIDARATSPALVVDLPCESLQAQIESHPGLAWRLITSLAAEVQRLSVHTRGLMHQDAPARFAGWLLQRCQLRSEGDGPAVVHLGERKRDIAAQLAITPETLSRLMASLSRQGVISVDGYIVSVHDRGALERIADA